MDENKISKYKCMDIYVTTQNEIIYVCLLCKNHIQYENINMHIKEHFNKMHYNSHEYDQYQCDNGNSAYTLIHNNNKNIKYDNKNRKVNSNEKNFGNKYLCYYCNEEFLNPHERFQHLIKHIKNTRKNQIPIVGNENIVVAVDISDLQQVKEQQQQHKQNEKILISIWTCDICCLEFHNNGRFNEHILEHKNGYLPTNLETRKSKKKYKYDSYKRKPKTLDEYHICHVCGIRMADITNLKNHIDTHTGEKRYQCEICEKRFTQATALKNHMRIHTNEKSINCTLCDRKFRINADLRSHMYRHNNIRRHECTYCEKKFYESDQLKAHIRTHTGEKPFQCDICKEYFRTQYCMKTHRRLHTGEKPFKCRICEKPFAQLAGLHGHMKSCTKKIHNII